MSMLLSMGITGRRARGLRARGIELTHNEWSRECICEHENFNFEGIESTLVRPKSREEYMHDGMMTVITAPVTLSY